MNPVAPASHTEARTPSHAPDARRPRRRGPAADCYGERRTLLRRRAGRGQRRAAQGHGPQRARARRAATRPRRGGALSFADTSVDHRGRRPTKARATHPRAARRADCPGARGDGARRPRAQQLRDLRDACREPGYGQDSRQPRHDQATRPRPRPTGCLRYGTGLALPRTKAEPPQRQPLSLAP
jgi:hypothetical protein